jgi:nitrate/nitrite transport system permease protein
MNVAVPILAGPAPEWAHRPELRTVASEPPALTRSESRPRAFASSIVWALIGFAVVGGLWQLATVLADKLPTPGDTLSAIRTMAADPFYDNGPNDKGIGLRLWSSLGRVAKGWGLAVIVGVPLGLFMGASKRAWRAANPVVQLLRPVSPLAWFPIWLVYFQQSDKAAVWTIFITALWPTVLNTAAGAAAIPDDHRHVARVFKFGRMAYVRHILVPDSLPSIVTGLRLSMGIAWMVIVATEMLSGGVGAGTFIWDAYNASNLNQVAAAIVFIGIVGFALDLGFLRLGRAVAIEKEQS